jgi:hypothetical protein
VKAPGDERTRSKSIMWFGAWRIKEGNLGRAALDESIIAKEYLVEQWRFNGWEKLG